MKSEVDSKEMLHKLLCWNHSIMMIVPENEQSGTRPTVFHIHDENTTITLIQQQQQKQKEKKQQKTEQKTKKISIIKRTTLTQILIYTTKKIN